ncbi:MAG: hypothetical protein HZA06_05730 [Nitrospirae bacterium]|nr:hypothetical protein [Nitrospirota bacterium]
MDETTLVIACATLLSGLLIVINEWVKKYFENKHKIKKFELWVEILNEGKMGKELSTLDPFLYELLAEGLVETKIKSGAKGNNLWAVANT